MTGPLLPHDEHTSTLAGECSVFIYVQCPFFLSSTFPFANLSSRASRGSADYRLIVRELKRAKQPSTEQNSEPAFWFANIHGPPVTEAYT